MKKKRQIDDLSLRHIIRVWFKRLISPPATANMGTHTPLIPFPPPLIRRVYNNTLSYFDQSAVKKPCKKPRVVHSYSGVGILHAYLCEYNIIIVVYNKEFCSSEESERERQREKDCIFVCMCRL